MLKAKRFLQYWHTLFGIFSEQDTKDMKIGKSRSKGRKIAIWVLIFLVLAVSLLNANSLIAQTLEEKYRKAVTKDITYGREKENIGLLSIKDLPRRGPESFSNDAEGNFYVCDTVNHRIQVFSPNGNHLYEIYLEEGQEASDIAVDKFGNIYVYDDVQGNLYQYDKKGNFLGKIEVDFKRWQSRGPMHIIDYEIYIRSSDQEDILIGRIVSGSLVPPTAENCLQPLTKGIHGFSGRRYFVELVRMEKGIIKIIDKKGNATGPFDLPLKGIVSLRFLQEDKKGNFYIQTERVDNEKLVLEVHKFSAYGTHLTTALIPENDYSSWSVKLLSLDENGNIYQFLPAKAKGQINIFRKE